MEPPSPSAARPLEYNRPGVEIELIDPREDAGWDREAFSHPEATLFHSGAWARVLAATYGHRPRYCRFTRGGSLLALVPMMELRSPLSGRRGVSLPFTDLCEPLLFAETGPEPLTGLLAGIARERGWKYFELRGGPLRRQSATPAVAFYGHSLNLGDAQELFATLAPSVRRAIRKAERSGIEATITGSREAMIEFYGLHTQTRRRHGLPPQPISFFLNIHEQIVGNGLGFISMVRSGGVPIAAAIFFHQGRTGLYKFGASDAAHQELRPNNLAMWRGMTHLAERGAATLHMGRTSLHNEGLRQFKLGWGTAESTIEYFKFDTAAGTWAADSDRASGIHNAIFSRLPLPINRLMGRLLYPHLD
jgi:CelD/BcsL family acetyltransferase involved in cellulose biosynthesis